jgi:hypothetical protein
MDLEGADRVVSVALVPAAGEEGAELADDIPAPESPIEPDPTEES